MFTCSGCEPAQTGPFRSPQKVIKMGSTTQAQEAAAAAQRRGPCGEHWQDYSTFSREEVAR